MAKRHKSEVIAISAEKYRERYYLYRVYEKDGNFTLIEVNNPLRFDEKAIDVQYEINPFRSEKSEKWSIIEYMESTN
ncbi:hypothetical protein [Thermaerobacillus caldiproteolyticus]|uniref:Uncharacterized protein n=1 Tax=Thermaerobacillus caldiproteolyticus TaxID=247480 RepID=A0A7W0BZ02_9BACL|nr:hypothetical protein [Anoxybacillus caldiproteolyticus]MBA2876246.1 hypothetical protein [Anoxybacillus caldiproteolyticus]